MAFCLSSPVSSPDFRVKTGKILTSASNTYQIEKYLKMGRYAQVTLAVALETNTKVALKVKRGEREARILRTLKSLYPDKNYLQILYEHFIDGNHFCIVTELLDEDLWFFRRYRVQHLDICDIRAIAQQCLSALKALKSFGIVHANILPNNIMFVNQKLQPLRLKLIDFACATET